ncbi:MAG: hypothetical protein H0V04_01880 [Chloroflexi bacterium]|nr:hypothetical protein [Chloroflexota bacterium]
MSGTKRRYRAVWAYPWDLVDRGPAACLEEIAQLGFTAVSVAAVYHSVQAFLPRNPRRQWFTASRSHANYRPDPRRYPGLGPTKALAGEDESFGDVAAAVEAAGLELTAWAVLTHSSLATAEPRLAIRPLGGASQPGLLCPANPAVAEYVVALARELDERFAPAALDLETIGWGALPHHPHAKVALPLGASGRYLLSLCFCETCAALAPPGLTAWVTARLKAELGGSTAAVPVEVLLAECAELASFQTAREAVVLDLVGAVAECVSARVQIAHWGEPRQAGIDLAAVAAVADRVIVLDYGMGGREPGATIADAARIAGHSRIVAGLSVCSPQTPDEAGFGRTAAVARAAGVEEISVYNASLVDRQRLEWAGTER